MDGVLDDAAWAQAATVDLPFEVTPGDNTPAPVKTTVRMAYTDRRTRHRLPRRRPRPPRIRAYLRDRDSLYSDDFVGVMLDTFDDERRAYEFFVNPLGVQADLIKEEATSNEDDSWDGLWTSAARSHRTGIRRRDPHPLHDAALPRHRRLRRWGATFLRIRPRDFRYQYFSNRVERGSQLPDVHLRQGGRHSKA